MHRRAHRPAIRSLLAALAILCLTAVTVGQAHAAPRTEHVSQADVLPTCLPSGVVPPGAPLPTCLPGGAPSLGAPAPGGPADSPPCLPAGAVPSQLPVPSCLPDIASGGLPSGVPTCLPSNVVPSQLPVPTCLALSAPPSCLPLPTGVVPTEVPVPVCPPSGSSTTETPTPSSTATTPVTTTSSQIATVPTGGVDTGGGPDQHSGLLPALAIVAGIGATAALILWRRRRLGWG